MHQKFLLFILLGAGLLCLSLAPVSQAQDQDEDMEVDVEDDLDLGLAGTEDDEEEELEGDEQDEAPPASKTPAAPKVTYRAPEPMGEHFFAESFDRGTLDGYEVNFQSGIDCGGAYIKLLTETSELDLDQFVDKTPYTIMFGPDKCGEDYKLHFIFRHKNPKTGEYEEKHAKKPDADLRSYFTDKKTHLYTLGMRMLLLRYPMKMQSNRTAGWTTSQSMSETQTPSNLTTGKSPWQHRPSLQQIVLRCLAVMTGPLSCRDEDMDGEWEAPQIPNPACESAPGCGPWKRPMIDNPNYKGKWKPSMIDNPNYQVSMLRDGLSLVYVNIFDIRCFGFQGIWKPRKIPNPNYFEDLQPFRMTPFSALGLELWSMTSDIFFDNFFITNDRNTADRWTADGWGLKKAAEGAAEVGSGRLNSHSEEEWC
ncbi:hypothetical protein GOODEAATRI_017425 [Goodea atripinnis]|uniref:Calnexin n=1 Tax=Goodea atripinnis TaxID=208336 RepID=A0ABV0PZC1_9TELE